MIEVIDLRIFVNQIPTSVHLVIWSFSFLCLLGWLFSIRAAFKIDKGRALRLLAIFPLTTPFALLILLLKDRVIARLPCLLYLTAALVFIFGGIAAKSLEHAMLNSLVRDYEESRGSIAITSMIQSPVRPEENVWDHPLLAPIGNANTSEKLKELHQSSYPYKKIRQPTHTPNIKYSTNNFDTTGWQLTADRGALRSFHENSIRCVNKLNPILTDELKPKDWFECGAAILKFFEPTQHEFEQLREAVDRPHDIYPYRWEDASEMAMQNLSIAKAFTVAVVSRSQAYSATQQPEKAFEDLELAFKLRGLGYSDLLIARLVDIAQARITLRAIQTGQQFHSWTDDHWRWIQEQLDAIDYPISIPATLRVELMIANESVEHILKQSLADTLPAIKRLSHGPPQSEESKRTRFRRRVLKFLPDPLPQAILVSDWRRGIEFYIRHIRNVESAVLKSQSLPWADLSVPPLASAHEDLGVFAQILLPSLTTFLEKTIAAQAQIEIASLACSLERHFLANDRYPQSLNELVPKYISQKPIDPMTQKPWTYKPSVDGQGFTVYSVGWNRKDDNGLYDYQNRARTNPNQPDDFSLSIANQVPPLPELTIITPPDPSNPNISEKMMHRYGLTPKDRTE